MMPVKTKEELQGLLDQGWHLYHHSTQRRWYVFKDELHRGKKHRTTRIVDARLDKICEELKEAREESAVSAGEIQDARWEGERRSRRYRRKPGSVHRRSITPSIRILKRPFYRDAPGKLRENPRPDPRNLRSESVNQNMDHGRACCPGWL